MGDVERSGPARLVDRVFGDPGAILHNLVHVRIFACYEFLTLGSRRGRTHAKAQKPDLRAHVQSNFGARGWPPGTEFLDAETARQKSLPKCAHVHRDQNPGIDWPKIPAETPYLASYRKRAVCGDWMVVCAVLCEPVSPVSTLFSPVLPCSATETGQLFRLRPHGPAANHLNYIAF